MDKKFLKRNYLMESYKKFIRLSGAEHDTPANRPKGRVDEWSFVPSALDEAGDDDDNGQDGGPAGGGDAGLPPMGGEGNGGDDGTPPAPTVGPGSDNGGDAETPPRGGDGPDNGPDGNQAPQITPPKADAPGGPDDDKEESGDDVIDVTKLTNAQEKMNSDIKDVEAQVDDSQASIDKLISSLSSIQDIIAKNNEKIEDLQREVQRRNPTPLEKLDLRSVESSKPYNIRPNDYWADKIASSPNYAAYDENEEDPSLNKGNNVKREYTITSDDVKDFTDQEMRDSLKDAELDFDKIFGLS